MSDTTVARSNPGPDFTSFALALVASTFLMGTSFVAGKILLQDGFEPLVLVGWRFVVAALATLPLVLLDPSPFLTALVPRPCTARTVTWIVIIGLIQTTGVMGFLFVSMRYISASTAAILLFTSPIWVAALSRYFFNEPLTAARVIGLVLGVLGVTLAIGLGKGELTESGALLGEMLALASALCFAASTIIAKRVNLPLGVWALNFWQMLIGALALLVIAYAAGEHWPVATTNQQWLWFFWLAIPGSAASFGLWFLALSKGGATAASSFLFLAPLFTVVLSTFFLDASISWPQLAGGVCIGIALWLVNR